MIILLMKMHLLLGIVLTAGFMIFSARAQHMNEKDSPCVNAVQTAELGRGLALARDKADATLDSVYRDLRNRLEGPDAQALIKAQSLWIQYRDANCSAERDLYQGGTASSAVYYACLESMTRARTQELQTTYAVRLK